MSAPRLTSLWPSLWRTTSSEVYNPALRSARAAQRIQAYHSSHRRAQQEAQTQRYGTANEPPGHLGGGKLAGKQDKNEEGSEEKSLPRIGEKVQRPENETVESKQSKQGVVVPPEEREATTDDGRTIPLPPPAVMRKYNISSAAEPPPDPPAEPPPEHRPLASYLDAASKAPDQAEEQHQKQEQLSDAREHSDEPRDESARPKAPHMDTPLHVHHFDTYGLVKRLNAGSWADRESIAIMKAVRLMLAENTDLAQKALVSKSNLENEAYLFKAACAELKTEVMARRRAEQERMRTERDQLQHEVDILRQRLGQESAAMKDELKGMFDDRKMAVRNEQRSMESKVQQLNYAITVSLQADAKSEVEGLRWIMTRRVILTLGILVAMIIGGLKLWSTSAKEASEGDTGKKSKAAKSAAVAAQHAARAAEQGEQSMMDEELRRETKALSGGQGEVVVREGDNPAFVSLG